MSAPTVTIVFELEAAAPRLRCNYQHEGDALRMADWLEAHPMLLRMVKRAIELAEEDPSRVIVGDPLERARALLVFADGFDAAGGGDAELARRARVAARDVLELAGMLEAERSARVAIQVARDGVLVILERQAGQAAAREARNPSSDIEWTTNGRNPKAAAP